MQMGSNTDVRRLGLTVHVQTEDHGLATKKMTTQVFFSGAIVDSRTISYEDDIAGLETPPDRDEKIRKLMKAMHKHFITRITSGSYDERLPLSKVASAEVPVAAEAAADIAVDIPVDDLVRNDEPGSRPAWRGIPVTLAAVEHDLSEAILDALRPR